MKFIIFLFILFFCQISFSQESTNADYPISPIPFSHVVITDPFWSKKIKINHEVTIALAIQKSKETGRIDNFKKAAGLMPGSFGSEYPFDDSDVYKIIEAASYSIQIYPDQKLEASLDSLIYFISKAQEPDGYLYTNRTIKEGKIHPWAGEQRWEKVNELSHELYNLGHMYEAAAAHFTATAKTSLLDVAIKSANLLCEVFGPNKLQNYPGHQEIEIGLVKLYRITGNRCYLNLAKFFLDIRGKDGIGRPDSYNQSHLRVIDQKEAVGHSVRASYMWTGMADVAAITGNKEYTQAINLLWHDVVDKKYYINGGIGSTRNHEGFGPAYDLPNMTAYNETCAGVGNATWNHRMFLMTGDSKFIDILERTMYNNILTGVSYEGDHFFYPNPLASQGQHKRSEWFGCACCPPNVARFIPSMPGYIYAQNSDEIFVNLYVSSETNFSLSSGNLSLSQESQLPWNGDVSIQIQGDQTVNAVINFRIPGWARNRPVPGELYHYIGEVKSSLTIQLNDQAVDFQINEKGYVSVSRTWRPGDKIEIKLPCEIRKVEARNEVIEDRKKIAIERGPLLYCAEWPDNGDVQNLILNTKAEWRSTFDSSLFGGIVTIQTEMKRAKKNLKGGIDVSESTRLNLIPYHLWNNRGPGQMLVWLPTSIESTKASPSTTIAARSHLSSSGGSAALNSIVDQETPKSSSDEYNPFFHWWPKKDSWEWVQFDFDLPEKISEVKVYWFSDTPHGGTALPDSWELQYLSADTHNALSDQWLTVSTKGDYPIVKDYWSTIRFKEVRVTALRIRVKLNEYFAAGIHEIIIK